MAERVNSINDDVGVRQPPGLGAFTHCDQDLLEMHSKRRRDDRILYCREASKLGRQTGVKTRHGAGRSKMKQDGKFY